MAKIGRPRKYETAEELEQAVNAYFAAVSYQRPVIYTTATGEVDDHGNAVTVTQMLREGPDHAGPPVTVTEYLEPPCLAALCLYLGISRDTWARYAKKKGFRDVVEQTRTRIEAYLVGRLESKYAYGVVFNLKNNFGWSDKREVGLDPDTIKGLSVERFLREEARKTPPESGAYEY